jgi:hypothetical protein
MMKVSNLRHERGALDRTARRQRAQRRCDLLGQDPLEHTPFDKPVVSAQLGLSGIGKGDG